MKNNIYKSVLIIASIGLFIGCKPNIKVPAASAGSINPARYIAVGNSITSGFADGALYYDGQQVSYPNLIAQQLKLVGGGNFVQPLMPQASIGVGSTGNAPFKLDYSTDCLGVTSLSPVPTATIGDVNALSTNIYTSPGFNNMGVPGAKAITAVVPGYGNPANGVGNYNPFFYRMAKNPTTSSMLSDAMLVNPTFFSLFIGNNDVLLYATNGGASDFISPSAGPVGVGFDASINAIVDSLTKNGAKGVIANIPDITALPFFTTVPWNGLTLTQAQADQLNPVMHGLGITNYTYTAGNNPFVIYDQTANPPFYRRLIREDELIVLTVPLDSIKCKSMGTIKPIPNKYVLTETEIANIKNATIAYNNTIKSIANTKGLAFVDVNAFMQQAKTGIEYNGININATFASGGAFSLDGIHLTPLGNALLANEFIKAINATYGSTIPQVDPTKYHGVIFP